MLWLFVYLFLKKTHIPYWSFIARQKDIPVCSVHVVEKKYAYPLLYTISGGDFVSFPNIFVSHHCIP